MGIVTLDQFRQELLFGLRNRTDTLTPDGFTTARQDSMINFGYLHVTHPSVFRHRELQYAYDLPVVPGTFSYTFTPDPANVAITSIRSVSHVEGVQDDPTFRRTKLVAVDIQWTQERTHPNGSPNHYTVIGNQLAVFPVPDASTANTILRVHAFREPALLTDPAHTTVLSTIWDEIVHLASRWRAELHLGYRDLAEATKIDFVSLINEYQTFEQLQGEDWDWVAQMRNDSAMPRV